MDDVPGAPLPSRASAPQAAARWMNTLSGLLLVGASAAVMFAAAPAILRASLARTHEPTRLARGASTPPRHPSVRVTPHAPRFLFDDDADPPAAPDDLEHLSPNALPRQPSLGMDEPEERPRSGSGSDSDSAPRRELRLGLARRTLKLHEEAAEGATVLGEIEAGTQVVILKEEGPWALVVHSGNMGWTRKSEIAIR